MSFLGNLDKKAVEKAYDLAAKVEGGRDYLTTAANTVNSLVKGKDARYENYKSFYFYIEFD